MKKIFPIILASGFISILIPAMANATVTRITSYADLMTALKNGHRVSVITDGSKCTSTESGKAESKKKLDPEQSMIVGLSFNNNFFMTYYDETRLSAPHCVATIATNTLGMLGEGPKLRYKRVRVYEDNAVYLYASISDFNTGKETGRLETVCHISNGHDNNGAGLFDYDA